MEAARAYDVAAPFIHPHYVEVHDTILNHLSDTLSAGGLVVDLGGGSGILLARILERFPGTTGIVVDRAEPQLTLAVERLAAFGDRGSVHQLDLQENWCQRLSEPPRAIVSTSAIHHLLPAEKEALYQQCYECLAPGGWFLNGDEILATSDDEQMRLMQEWSAHMHHGIESGNIPEEFRDMVTKWHERNITHFGEPKQSGDDCHETVEVQLGYLKSAGFTTTEVIWQRKLWAVLTARK